MIYCFDLDGTLCTHVKDYSEASPFLERIKEVNLLYDQGHTIIIDTARGSTTGIDWYDITLTQLNSWGLKFHTLRTGIKITADLYIDDKAIKDLDFFNKNKLK